VLHTRDTRVVVHDHATASLELAHMVIPVDADQQGGRALAHGGRASADGDPGPVIGTVQGHFHHGVARWTCDHDALARVDHSFFAVVLDVPVAVESGLDVVNPEQGFVCPGNDQVSVRVPNHPGACCWHCHRPLLDSFPVDV